MTVANLNTGTTYAGTGAQVNFPITFAFIPGEASVVKVYLVLNTGVEVLQSEGGDYSIDDINNPTLVTMTGAPDADQFLIVRRESPKTQGTDLTDNTPFPGETIEDQLDRQTLVGQEICADVDLIEARVTTLEGGGAPPS